MTGGFAGVRLRRRALPERDLEAVSLQTRLLERTLQAPLLLWRDASPAAAAHGVALVVGSDGAAPDERPPLLLAELAAAHVRGRDGLWRAAEAIERVDADALVVELDPLAEALRPDGATDFSGVADGIAAVVAHIAPKLVLVTGAGDFEDMALLRDAGVAAIGVATVDALTDARATAPGIPLVVSAELRDGEDVARGIALGASAARVAAGAVGNAVAQLRIATWLAGAGHVQELGGEHLR